MKRNKRALAASLVLVLCLSSLLGVLPGKREDVSYGMETATPSVAELHPGGCLPSPMRDWPKVDMKGVQEELRLKGINSLPASTDLSPFEPPIGNQGSQGSCTAWAVGYYYKTFQERNEHSWNDWTSNHQFSPAFIYNQLNGGVDDGIAISSALEFLVDKGCDTLDVFPYNQHNYTTQPTGEQLQLALPFRAGSFANVFQGRGSCTDATIDTMKSWLANGDTFVINVPIYKDSPTIDDANYYHSTSYVIPPHLPVNDTLRGWHAMQVVGYSDSLFYNDGTDHFGAFKVANSWGTKYGYGGYVNLSYDFMKTGAIEAWTMTDAPTPSIAVVHPALGEVWDIGAIEQVGWEESNTVGGEIQLFFKTSSSGTWIPIDTLAIGSNQSRQYPWVVPGPASTDCYLLVVNNLVDGTYLASSISGPFTMRTGVSPDFSVSASPVSRSVSPGNSTTYSVALAALNGFASPVALSVTSGLPTGTAASFSLSPLTPAGVSAMTVSTSASTPIGTYAITITAAGGGKTHCLQVALNVSSSPDFSISVSPDYQAVASGGSTAYTVTVAAQNGFDSPVSLSVSGLPTGVAPSFSLSPLVPSVSGSMSTLTIDTSQDQTVTLTLYIYENSLGGSPLQGVSVGVTDGGGNPLSGTTNASGYVTITGVPGTWNFTAMKPGYDTNSWSQPITSTCTKYGYIVKNPTFAGALEPAGSDSGGSLDRTLMESSSFGGSAIPTAVSDELDGSRGTEDQNHATSVVPATVVGSEPASTPSGSYILTIAATGGGKTHTAQVTLNVTLSLSPPSVPQDFTATPGNGQVTLGWSAPASSGVSQ